LSRAFLNTILADFPCMLLRFAASSNAKRVFTAPEGFLSPEPAVGRDDGSWILFALEIISLCYDIDEDAEEDHCRSDDMIEGDTFPKYDIFCYGCG